MKQLPPASLGRRLRLPDGSYFIGRSIAQVISSRALIVQGLTTGLIYLRMLPSTVDTVHEELERVLARYSETVLLHEVELILNLRSNNPAIGYNRWPRFEGQGLQQSIRGGPGGVVDFNEER